MLRFLTAGESHGRALVAILENFPKGVEISEAYIQAQLARRQKGYGRGPRQKIEEDRAQILSGVRFGKTLGSPIALLIENKDYPHWEEKMSAQPQEILPPPVTAPRPGHADLAGLLKYGDRDVRNILERASARETAARVAVGAFARKLLENFSIQIYSWVVNIGGAGYEESFLEHLGDLSEVEKQCGFFLEKAEASPVRCPEPEIEKKIVAKIEEAMAKKDTLGGIFQVVVTGLPPGLGSFMHWDRKLDGRLAQALMSIPAVKGVEIGSGFQAALEFGTAVHDPIYYDRERSFFYRSQNRAGGLEAGVTNGMPLVIQAAMKPIATTMKGLPSVDVVTKEPVVSLKERSDVCAVPACSIVAEAVVALVLADAFLEKFGGDTLDQISESYTSFQEALKKY